MVDGRWELFYLFYFLEDMQSNYQTLTVWQKAMDLAEKVYELTKKFPASEIY